MGGSSGKTSGGGGKSGRQSGGAGSGNDACPSRLRTTVMGPAPGLTAGTWLGLILDKTGARPRVVLVDLVTNVAVGTIGAVPNLDVLINCLDGGVAYRAFVDSVSGGRVEITVVRQ